MNISVLNLYVSYIVNKVACIDTFVIYRIVLNFRGTIFSQISREIYSCENIIVNIHTSLTFCGNSDHCLLAFHENLNANILF